MRFGSGWEFYRCESRSAAVFSLPSQTLLVSGAITQTFGSFANLTRRQLYALRGSSKFLPAGVHHPFSGVGGHRDSYFLSGIVSGVSLESTTKTANRLAGSLSLAFSLIL